MVDLSGRAGARPGGGARRLPAVAVGGRGDGRAAALPAGEAAAIAQHALLPDAFYRRVFAQGMAARPVLGALYLPGLDIAAAAWRGSDLAFSDLVRRELGEVDRLVAAPLEEVDTVIVVFDPGRRRSGGEGRIVVWRRQGCPQPHQPPGGVATPERVAATLLRVLGLPQSRELPPPLPLCRWPEPPAEVETFGEPHGPAPSRAEGGEYLESLRSLGYL